MTSAHQVARASDRAADALQKRNATIIAAHKAGLTIRVLAAAANLSSSRVHQILHHR